MIGRWFWLLIILSWCSFSQANILVLEDSKQISREDVAQALLLYTGDSAPQSLSEAAQRKDGYRPAAGYVLLRGAKGKRWMRFVVRNHGNVDRDLVLDLNHALLREIEVRIDAGGVITEHRTGQAFPKETRDLNVNGFMFRVDVPAMAMTQIDFAVASTTGPLLHPNLYDLRDVGRYVLQQSHYFGFVIGQIFAVGFILICYLLWLQRSREIFYLLLFCIFGAIGVLFHSGVLAYNYPKIFSNYGGYVHLIIQASSLALLAKLLQSFYLTKKRHYWVHQLLNGVAVICVGLILALPVVEVSRLTGIFFWLQLVSYIGILWFCLFCLLNGRRGMPLFICVGMVVYVGILLLRLLSSIDVVPVLPLSQYFYELALSCMMDMLCVAVVAAMLKSQRDAITASQNVLRIESEMQARSDVVAKITHDIKSPLTAILGAEQLLRDKRSDLTPAEEESYLSIIRTSGYMVLSMVDDVLLHAEVKRGHLRLQKDQIDIRQWMTDCERTIRVAGLPPDVLFTCTAAADLPQVVVGDQRRLTQVITNLLNNAFKFTDEGFVNLNIDLLSLDQRNCELLFTVSDSGIGMSEEFINRAFDSYAREASSAVAGKIGFGLGLAICQQLVNEMQGRIKVESVQGVGTVFRVSLPFSLPMV